MLRPHHSVLAHFGAAEDCNASASKKRSRDKVDPSPEYIPHQFNMHQQSSSTSGWLPSVGLPISQGLMSQFYQQRIEIDCLVRLKAERMRSELEAMGKRQCRDTLSIVGQQVLKMMKDKDAEFERASRRNKELEQKVRELAAESLIWLTAAKNSEALACHLKSIEQALQNAASTALSDDCDAESCCYRGDDGSEELRRRTACKVCGEKEVCALILPCRHLCLCKDCEPMFDTCPVCHSTKSGSLQIFLS